MNGAKSLTKTLAVFGLFASADALAQETCAAIADSSFAAADDMTARATIAAELQRGGLACGNSLLRARQSVLLGRDERAATIARLDLRDLVLATLREPRFSAEERLALVLAATTPHGASNQTPTDSRADTKLLRIAAVQMLSEQAYGAWLDAFTAWLRVSPRSDTDVRPLLLPYRSEEPFVALWKSGDSARVLELMHLIANEPNLDQLRKTLGFVFWRADECSNAREEPSAAMVMQCREQLRNFRELEALGCWGCHPAATSEMMFEVATVIFRSGAIMEGSVAFERAIEMLTPMAPKERSSALEHMATRLERLGYSPERVAALREEAETVRLNQYQPLFPPVQ